MAARHDGKSPIAGFAVGQLPGHGDTAAVYSTVLLVVPHRGTEGFTGAVQGMALGALGGADEQGTMVEAKTLAAEFVQAGDGYGVDQEAAKRVSIGGGQLSMPVSSRRLKALLRAAESRARLPL